MVNTASIADKNYAKSVALPATFGRAAVILLLLGVLYIGVVHATRTPLQGSTPASAAVPTIAQSAAQSPSEKVSQITVRGTGILNAKPDIMVGNVGVSAQDENVKGAQTKVSTVITSMQSKLKAAGIEDKDYRTVQYSVDPVMDYSASNEPGTASDVPKLVGFRVTNMLEIIFRQPDRAVDIIGELVSAGANTIYNVGYTFSDPTFLSRQAYDQAMQDAQSEAAKLANLSHMQLGRIVSVTDFSANTAGYTGASGLGGGGAGGAGGGAGPFYPGLQPVRVDVIVTYEAERVDWSGGSDLEQARAVLLAYFGALNEGRYDEAAKLYGGEYTTLMEWNPEVSPDDHARLFERGCKVNGLQCLKVKQVVSGEQLSPSEFRFVVEFANADGSLFKLGQTSGAEATQQPAKIQFEYVVEKMVDGGLLVRGLPVYLP